MVSLRGRHGRNLRVVMRLTDGVGFSIPFCEGVKRIISLRLLNSQVRLRECAQGERVAFLLPLVLLWFWACDWVRG